MKFPRSGSCIVLAGLIAVISFTRLDAGEKAMEFCNGVVVAVSEPAAEAGLAILKQGGNAVDAAVTTALDRKSVV